MPRGIIGRKTPRRERNEIHNSRFKIIKDSIFAWYDPNSDKVIGANEGGIVWHHEMRHKEQFDNKIMSKLFYVETLLVRCGGSIAVISALLLFPEYRIEWFFFGGLMLVPSTVMSMCIEVDAWVFGAYRYFKNRKCLSYE